MLLSYPVKMLLNTILTPLMVMLSFGDFLAGAASSSDSGWRSLLTCLQLWPIRASCSAAWRRRLMYSYGSTIRLFAGLWLVSWDLSCIIIGCCWRTTTVDTRQILAVIRNYVQQMPVLWLSNDETFRMVAFGSISISTLPCFPWPCLFIDHTNYLTTCIDIWKYSFLQFCWMFPLLCKHIELFCNLS